MLPQLSAIPIQSSEASPDASRNINRTFPVGQNVSATVVAVSRDQVQPEIFRLNLEVNNRLIQMGVFQPLPVGQKISVNRQSDGQIQITLPPSTKGQEKSNQTQQPTAKDQPTTQSSIKANRTDTILKIQIPNTASSNKLPIDTAVKAAVISSRPVYPQAPQPAIASTGSSNPTTPNSATLSTTNIGSSVGFQPTTPLPTSITNSTPPIQTNAKTSAPSSQAGTPTQTPTNISNPNQLSQPAQQSTTQQTSPPTPSTPAPTTPTNSTANTTSPSPVSQGQTATPTASSQPPQINSQNIPSQPGKPPVPTQQQGTATTTIPTRPAGPIMHHAINVAMPDGTKIEINSPRPLPQGTEIQLTRSSNGEVQITRIQNPSLTPTSALERPGIQETLRDVLPRQIPTADAFNQLSQATSRSDSSQMTQLSSAVRSMLQLFGIQPGTSESAAQIRQNIELGGMTTERMLSRGMAPPNDLKSQLQQLQRLTDDLPAEQRERIEQLLKGIHSRVTSQQLHSLQQWKELPDGGFERVLQLDLPIKQGENWENLELRLSREGGTNSSGELVSVWRVRLHFDLDERGGLDAEIRLTDDHEIRTLFWCEQPETAKALQDRAEEFAGRLRECGFSNSEVDWHEGVAPEQNSPVHKQLIDLHT